MDQPPAKHLDRLKKRKIEDVSNLELTIDIFEKFLWDDSDSSPRKYNGPWLWLWPKRMKVKHESHRKKLCSRREREDERHGLTLN